MWVVLEGSDIGRVFHEPRRDLLSAAVATPYPDDFARRPNDLAAFLEIRTLGDNRKAMLQRVLPDGFVAGAVKPGCLDVRRSWICFGEMINQTR